MLIIMLSPPKSLLITYVIFLLLLLRMTSTGSCSRVLKEVEADEFKRSIQGMLPRGLMPPSGPSPCHNKLSPFRDTELSYNHDDYVMCPVGLENEYSVPVPRRLLEFHRKYRENFEHLV
ncbi:hypothetical protein ACFX2A_020981 [Malus domestica]